METGLESAVAAVESITVQIQVPISVPNESKYAEKYVLELDGDDEKMSTDPVS